MNSVRSVFSSACAMVFTFKAISPCLFTNKKPIPTTIIFPNSANKGAFSKYISSRLILAGFTKFFAFFSQNSFILSERREKSDTPDEVSMSMNRVFLKFFNVSIYMRSTWNSNYYAFNVSRETSTNSILNKSTKWPLTTSETD